MSYLCPNLLYSKLVYQPPVGAWLSLVERLVRDQEVAGSNPAAPTKFFQSVYEWRSGPPESRLCAWPAALGYSKILDRRSHLYLGV